MSIVDVVEKKVVTWVLGKSLKKAIARGVTLAVAWVAGLGLSSYGVEINQEAFTAAVYMGLEVVRNWVKIKYPRIGKFL